MESNLAARPTPEVTPVFPGGKKEREIADLLGWFASMQKERQLYEEMWDMIQTYVDPRRYNFKGLKQRGQIVGEEVFDGTAQSAHNILVSGFHGQMLSAQFPWVRLIIPTFGMPRYGRGGSAKKYNQRYDKVPEIRRYLEDMEWALYNEFQRSNFYSSMIEFISDASGIGTATIYMEEDVVAGKVVYTVCNPGEVWISTNLHGQVDVVFRKFKMSVRALKQKFKKLPDYIAMNQNPEELFEIIHAVYPRDEREMYREGADLIPKWDATNMPWASVYMLEKTKDKVEELGRSGYRKFPYAVWRWRVNSEETYGRSPSADAIVTVLGGNIMSKSLLKVAQLAAQPPWNIPAEMRGAEQIVPDGLNYFLDKDRKAEAIFIGNNYPIAKDREDEVRKIIKEFYYVDYFVMLSRAAMEGRQLSVPQVLEMQSEKASALGTIIGRFMTDGLDAINERTLELAAVGGRLPEMPQILLDKFGGEEIRYDYIAPLAQTQKQLFRTKGLMAGLDVLGKLESIKPGTMDLVKMDETAVELLDSYGFPAALFEDEEKVEAVRQQRAEQVAKQEAVQQALLMSQAVPNLSKAVEQDSPLKALAEGVMPE